VDGRVVALPGYKLFCLDDMSTLLAAKLNTDQATEPLTGGIRNLDALRALAVLFVLFSHTARVVKPAPVVLRSIELTGKFGVLLFFIHTSLVLMMSIERNSAHSATSFYIRRAFRIYPLSTLCILAVLLFHIPPMPPGNFVYPSAGKIATNVALTQNLFVPPSTGTNTSLSSPLWSLPFEVQMYLFLPGIFWFLRRYGRKIVWFLIEVSVILAIADILVFPNHVWVAEFFPCFMGGILAFTLMHHKPRLPYFLWPISLGIMTVTGVLLGLSAPVEWGICLLIGASIPLFRELPKGLVSRASFVIARYSYGIYLSHGSLLWLCFGYPQVSSARRWSFYCALVMVVPITLYHLVEKPAIELGRRLVEPSL
jgi:peptidoglycan/LPS O-acetylase OafA/YrhL